MEKQQKTLSSRLVKPISERLQAFDEQSQVHFGWGWFVSLGMLILLSGSVGYVVLHIPSWETSISVLSCLFVYCTLAASLAYFVDKEER